MYQAIEDQYMRQKLIDPQKQTEGSIITVGDFNTPLLERDRYNRHKNRKGEVKFNSALNQLHTLNLYRQL
jgi:hypothetical protein